MNLYKIKQSRCDRSAVFKLRTALLSLRDVHFHYFQAESCHFLKFSACRGNIPVQPKKLEESFFPLCHSIHESIPVNQCWEEAAVGISSRRRTCERPPSGIRTSLEGGDGAASIRTPRQKKAPLICKKVSLRIRLLLQLF